MDNAFRATMQRAINAGEETTPTVVSKKPVHSNSEDCLGLARRALEPVTARRWRAPFRWDAGASSDVLRQCARCIACGPQGSDNPASRMGWRAYRPYAVSSIDNTELTT